MAERGNEAIKTVRADKEFQKFMDVVAVSDKTNRNKIITDWLALLSSEEQIRLVNKLKERGVDYIPNENTRFFETS
tara:strand:+ start:435 stop:662 length:228 start_codon:yes stop_codon:yes gene_type:complete